MLHVLTQKEKVINEYNNFKKIMYEIREATRFSMTELIEV